MEYELIVRISVDNSKAQNQTYKMCQKTILTPFWNILKMCLLFKEKNCRLTALFLGASS